jgi:hypothetical protein
MGRVFAFEPGARQAGAPPAAPAAYPRTVSDLQCPATLLLARTGDPGQLVAALRGRNVARVYGSPGADGPAAAVAGALGVELVLDEDLGRVVDGPLDDLADARREALQAIADLHRGETVVVLLGPSTSGWEVVEVSVDGDGFVVRRWRGVEAGSVG